MVQRVKVLAIILTFRMPLQQCSMFSCLEDGYWRFVCNFYLDSTARSMSSFYKLVTYCRFCLNICLEGSSRMGQCDGFLLHLNMICQFSEHDMLLLQVR